MAAGKVVTLELVDLALAYGLILIAFGLARLEQIGQEKQMLWASARMVLQLIAVGYLLHLVFAIRSPLPVLLMLLVMAGFSLRVMGAQDARFLPSGWDLQVHRLRRSHPFLCSLVISYPLVRSPLPHPPAGMIIGNSMNGASLAAERLSSEIRERREEIETALCLGATSRRATEMAVRTASVPRSFPQ